MKKTATVSVIFLTLLLMGIAPNVLAIDKIKLGTAIKVAPEFYLPILAAEEKGIWKKNDLQVEWVPFKGSTLLMSGIASGDIQVGMAGVTGPLQAFSRGLPVTHIADLHPNTSWHLFVTADSKYKDVKDLKGAKIGTTRLGTVSQIYAIIMSKEAGIGETVQYIGTGGPIQSLAALKSGAIGAYFISTSVFAEVILKGEVRTIGDPITSCLPKEWLMELVCAHKDFVKEKPDTVKRVIKSLSESIEVINKDPQWVVKTIQREARCSEGAAKFTLETLKFAQDLRLSRKAMENVINFCVEYGIITKEQAPSVDEVLPKEFAR